MKKRVRFTSLFVLVALISVALLTGPSESQAASDKKVITWKLQSWASSGDATYDACLKFADLVKKASDGRLIIKPFNAGAIIPAGKEFDSVLSGSVEAVHGAPGWSLGYFPGAIFYNNTVGGLTANQQRMWLEYEGLKLAQKSYKKLGAHYVGPLTPHNAEVWAHSTKQLNSVADLKGFKIRMGSAALNEIFARMGASPVFMPGGEVYEATQRGIIDGFEYVTPSVNWGMGFQEVTKYMYLSTSRAPTDAQALFVNQKAWDELPADLQAIVTNATFAVADQYYVTEIVRDAEALKEFEKYGTIISKVPVDIEALLYKTAETYYDEQAAKDPAFKEIYDSVKRWQLISKQFNIQ
jgi:TRAP-type mannitol/chloroaromatic compound transport system substrate-binding protein